MPELEEQLHTLENSGNQGRPLAELVNYLVSHDASPDQAAEVAKGKQSDVRLHTYGHHFGVKDIWRNMNGNHSLEEVYAYAPPGFKEGSKHGPTKLMPYERIEDYVVTLRLTSTPVPNCQEPAFILPFAHYSFLKAFVITIHFPWPGYMVCICTTKAVPQRFLTTNYKWENGVSEYYHGTSLSGLVGICIDGFLPGLGAGSEEMMTCWVLPLRVTYHPPR